MTLSLLSLLRCCLFNSICVWVESLLSDVTRVYFLLLGLFSRRKTPATNHRSLQHCWSSFWGQPEEIFTVVTSGAKPLWLNNSVCWLQSSDVDCGPVFWISRRSPWPVAPLMCYLLMNRWWEETNTVMVYWAPDNSLYCCSSHFVWTRLNSLLVW